MTSKEALEKISNIELYHQEIYEDEDFDGDWTYEEYTEYDGLVCEVYKQEIDIIKQALECLVSLNNVWHENEPMESVDINAKHLQELYDLTNKLIQENKYLKDSNEALNQMLLQASNEAIESETENEQLKDSIEIKQKQVNECIDTLTQQNEKLKKAIRLLNVFFEFEIDVETETIYCCLGDVSLSGVTEVDTYLELLKEVIKNE